MNKHFVKAWLVACATLCGLTGSAMTQAQVLKIPAGPVAPDLECPVKKPTPRPTPAAQSDEVFEIPTEDVLLEFLKTLDHQTRQASGILSNFGGLPQNRPLMFGLWGDSHAAANFFTEELLRTIDMPKERVHPTFIPPTLARGGVRLPIRKQCQGPGWKYDLAYTSYQDNLNFSRGMARLNSTTAGSYLWVDFRMQGQQPNLRSLEILYAATHEKTRLAISVDDGPEHMVDLKLNERGAIQLEPEKLISTIKIRLVYGDVGLEGFVPKYGEAAALYFDTLAIPGATARSWKAVNPEYFKAQGNQTPYDVVMLEYGTNEGNQKPFDAASYESDLSASLKNMRAIYPKALCVLIGPTDRGILVARPAPAKGKPAKTPSQTSSKVDLLQYSRIHAEISRIQQKVGEQYACSFWNWQQAMEGPGGSYAWLKKNPPLMARDLIHLTVPGYQESARLFSSDMGLGKAFGK